MGFYFRLAPGVRVRVTPHGVRTSIGPRAARVHVGGGYRPGVSTGAGPVTLYHGVGGARRRSRSGGRSTPGATSRATVAAHQRQLTQAAKTAEAQQLRDAFQAILDLHRGEIPPVSPPKAPWPPPIDEAAIRRRHEAQALAGVRIFRRAARRQAREAAASAAEAEIAQAHAQATAATARVQAELDERWRELNANEPDVVLATLAEAFEDNEAHAAATGAEGDAASVVVVVPGLEMVPERMPSLTAAGNLSLGKVSKGDRNSYYIELLCGHLLATVRETFAVAPRLQSVHAAAVRCSSPDAYGRRHPECLLAAGFTRAALEAVDWQHADAARILSQVSTGTRFRQEGQAKEVVPLDLRSEPELARMVASIDIEHGG